MWFVMIHFGKKSFHYVNKSLLIKLFSGPSEQNTKLILRYCLSLYNGLKKNKVKLKSVSFCIEHFYLSDKAIYHDSDTYRYKPK